ncbi:(d)CMP kinase [Urbifossiella limnaea]|uniref:Cytidylate kinase n=1 Tax=Urbifossiella limnaea TaxID=2528023 RepID=A0A517XN09_9BACT|nr:(d)CMP kinase [Urbifossiella limnaea]QDU18893.1 Cytidylate kinase [Urbifossiella limnaea]
MIVTIDGPAGSGKSTAARGLAARLGFDYLDTGAMFRAVGLALRDAADADAVLAAVRLEMPPGRVLLDGRDVTADIRTPAAAQAASRVATVPAVRQFLAAEQRRIAAGRDMVCEGRDQGTAVFPDAACKFYLVADPLARAERRHRELVAKGEAVVLADVLAQQQERDARDAGRAAAPMRPAADAVVIDTTGLSPDDVLARLEEVVRRCSPART